MNRRAAALALIVSCGWRAGAAADVFDHPLSADELLRTTLALPAKTLAGSQVLTGGFTQRRSLPEIPKPLVSTGEFLLARDAGVYWHTLKPFESSFTLTRQGMVLRNGGTETASASTREQPGLRMAMEIFLALFALDVQQLERHFTLYGVSQDGQWQLGLRPRQKGAASMFREVVVTGSQHVERIDLASGNGDRTGIELSAVVARSSGLTAQEKQHFQ